MLNVSSLKILLEREEQHKQELVVLVETSARVAKHLVRQELDHVVQSLRGERRLLRSAQRPCVGCALGRQSKHSDVTNVPLLISTHRRPWSAEPT